MSSNIRIERQCEYCYNTFIAKMTTTRYCSHKCNSRHYKAMKREKKVEEASIKLPVTTPNTIPLPAISQKQYLSMKEAATLLGVHERTIMNLKNSCQLPYKKIGRRIVIQIDDLHAFISRKI